MTWLAHLLHWVSGCPPSGKSISTLHRLLLLDAGGGTPPDRVGEEVEGAMRSFGGCTLVPLRSGGTPGTSAGNLGSEGIRKHGVFSTPARAPRSTTAHHAPQGWDLFRQSFGRHPPPPQPLELGRPMAWVGGRFTLTLSGTLPRPVPTHLQLAIRAMRPEDLPAVANHLPDWQVVPTGLPMPSLVAATAKTPASSSGDHAPARGPHGAPGQRVRHLMERVPGRLRNTLPVIVLRPRPPGEEEEGEVHAMATRSRSEGATGSRSPRAEGEVVVALPGVGLLRRELAPHLQLSLSHHLPAPLPSAYRA